MNDENYNDLLVQSRFRNLILWNLLSGRPMYKTALAAGVSYGALGGLLNLRDSPFLTTLDSTSVTYRDSAIKIAAYFNLPPEYVFPFALYALGLPDKVERQYCSAELLPLLAARNAPALLGNPESDMVANEKNAVISEALSALTPRERFVVKMRFGLEDGVGHTLAETAKMISRTPERIRQLEAKAFRKLRQGKQVRKLRQVY